MIFIIQYF